MSPKYMPASYCLHCEEKLATKEMWPYCSQWCKTRARIADAKSFE